MRVTLRLSHDGKNRPRKLRQGRLRKIFGPKRTVVTGDWKETYNKELHDLYSSQILFELSKKGESGGKDLWCWEEK